MFSSISYAAFDPSTCSQTAIRCVGSGMEYDTDVTFPSSAFQTAINQSVAGDVVIVRDGTYTHNIAASSLYFLEINVSGTSGNPITIQSAEGEWATISGFGFLDDGSDPARQDEELIRVNGDFIVIKDMAFTNSSRYGITMNGSDGLVENVHVHNNWHEGIAIGRTGTVARRNVVRNSQLNNMRHGSGVVISRGSNDTNEISDSIIEYNISFDNGYQPNGTKVPAVTGDVAGGGNSDGFGVTKNCNDNASAGANICPNNIYRHNIAWHNADDGYDFSFGAGSQVIDNISFNNGPEGNRGFKTLRNVSGGLTFIGNVTLKNEVPPATSGRGIEGRFNDQGWVLHQISMNQSAHGIYVSSTIPAGTQVRNSMEWGNGNPPAITSGVVQSTNHFNSGTPSIANPSFVYTDINTNPTSTSFRDRRDKIYEQIRAALVPADGSALIDAGTFVAGKHCATADDDATTPHNPADKTCRHWMGSAPDIGAYEYGLVDATGKPLPPTISVTVP